MRLHTLEPAGTPERPEARELIRLRRAVPWLEAGPRDGASAILRAMAGRTPALADAPPVRQRRAQLLAALTSLVPAWHPAARGVARLAARAAGWLAPSGDERHCCWGHTATHEVRPHFSPAPDAGTPGGVWVAGWGGGGGQTWPGSWACWQDAALWGLARRGLQCEFCGVTLDLSRVRD